MRLLVMFCLLLTSLPVLALEPIRVRTDPSWALINNSVNVEFDFSGIGQTTFALGIYYTDGWGTSGSPTRRLSPVFRVDFHAGDPLQSGWHPNLTLQPDLIDHGDDTYGAALRIKARQSYRWVWDPLTLSGGLGVQARAGSRSPYLACYLCPTYELSLGWNL